MTEHPWQTIIGQAPSKSNTYRIINISGHAKLGKTASTEAYEKSFYMQVGPYRNMMISGFFELYVRVYFTTMSHDLDNSLKTILDCLQYVKAIKDDNLCMGINTEKRIDRKNPRIVYAIEEFEPRLF